MTRNWRIFCFVVFPLVLIFATMLFVVPRFLEEYLEEKNAVVSEITASPAPLPRVLTLREQLVTGIPSCDGKPISTEVARRQTGTTYPFGVLTDDDREAFVRHFPKGMHRLFFADRTIAAVAYVGRIPRAETKKPIPMFLVYFKTDNNAYCLHHTSIVSKSLTLKSIADHYE